MNRRLLGVAAGVALLLPSVARADTICATGSISLYACASINVSFIDAGSGAGAIVVQVANLDAWTNNTFTGSAVDGFRLTGFGIVGNPSLVGLVTGLTGVSYTNASSTSGNVNQWSVVIDDQFSSIDVNIGATSQGANGGILGCLPDGGPANYSATCGANKYVAFTFSTNTTLANLQALYPTNSWGYGVRGQSGGATGSESYRCLDNDPNDPDCLVDRDDPPTTISEVPEPLTMILLGTGLAGIGAARRRRKNGDVANS